MATDNTKAPVGELMLDFPSALREVAKVKQFGLKKHPENSWKSEPISADTNAMIRHFLAEAHEIYDKESALEHAAHLAWRALARLEKLLEGVIITDEEENKA